MTFPSINVNAAHNTLRATREVMFKTTATDLDTFIQEEFGIPNFSVRQVEAAHPLTAQYFQVEPARLTASGERILNRLRKGETERRVTAELLNDAAARGVLEPGTYRIAGDLD